MLQTFWLDLLQNNPECVVYFHNWAGYDAILSLTPLLSLHTFGYTFKPILQNGERHSTYSSSQEKELLTIKDSMKLIPGGLGKLAEDFKVETQKGHFPHYFNPLEQHGTLN
jgi:hypothetical protein